MALLHDGKSQASSRRYVHFKDQHGRKWGANIELKSGAPTGHWTPPSAPITAPAHCLKITGDFENPFRVTIDYDRIIREGREALDEWEKARAKLEATQPNVTERKVEFEIGRRPPAVEPWIAAKQGDQWTLGLTTRVNQKVAAFLDLEKRKKEPEYDFTAEDNYLDIEEDEDRDGLGGKRVPVRRGKKSTESQEAA